MTNFTLTDSTGTVYTLSMPNWDGEKRKVNKNVVALDFWDNTFEVFDKGLNDEPVSLYGVELSTVTETIITGYFDSYDEDESEWGYAYQITDGVTSTYGLTDTVGNIELLNTNTLQVESNKIQKVELRVMCRKYISSPEATLQLTPVYPTKRGSSHLHAFSNYVAFAYSEWFDITEDLLQWSPDDIRTLNIELELQAATGTALQRMTCVSIIQIRVTYTVLTNTQIEAIDSLANYNQEVTIDGLGDCYDGVYVLTSFSYKTMKGTNQALEWEMELQHVRD